MVSSASGPADPGLLNSAWERVRRARRVVIKIGSNLLTANGTELRRAWIADRCREIAALKAAGRQVVVVTSGATAAGTPRLGLTRFPRTLAEKQAAAAAGMGVLLGCYEAGLAPHGIHAGQVLITRDDVHNRRRYLNARDTFETLLKFGLVPVVNENDTVMVEELKHFGDNDTLSANVAGLVGAELLILLSDVEGLFDRDPRVNPDARLIPLVEQVTPEIEGLAGGVGSAVARGGMATKLRAAKMATRSGCAMVLTSGFRDDPITEVFQSTPGTLFPASGTPLSAMKSWIANARVTEGEVWLDAGAVRALVSGKSLLAKGIVKVQGDFDRGATIRCVGSSEHTRINAKGMVNYNAFDLKKIAGRHSREFEDILGYVGDEEVIHRDAMVMEISISTES